jgi:N-ethylmaleimide reductase
MPTAELFSAFALGEIPLANRIVMAPMTRCRATAAHVPTGLMAEYYGQRATAGLIVTEGIAPCADGAGYARIPGLYTAEQVEAWRPVTAAARAGGAKIFAQLMHTGRVGHPLNMEAGARILAPSAVALSGTLWTDAQGMQPHPEPVAMTEADIASAIQSFADAAAHAVAAGFDGVEIHGANGYLVEQFLNPAANRRNDAWGGSGAHRQRFALEVARAVIARIGAGRTGIRLSPHGVFNDMAADAETGQTHVELAGALGRLGLAYLHLVDHSPMGAPVVPETLKASMRTAFGGTLILSGGYDRARAEADLAAGRGELVAFGRPFIANPDLVRRLRENLPLATPDSSSFYLPGPAGYTDYPPAG